MCMSNQDADTDQDVKISCVITTYELLGWKRNLTLKYTDRQAL